MGPYWGSIRNEEGHLHPCKTRSAHSIIENRCVGQSATFSIMNTLHFNRPWLSFPQPQNMVDSRKKWNKFDKIYWFGIKSHILSLLSDIVETAVKKDWKRISLPSSAILVKFKVQWYDIESHILLRDIGETAWGTSGFPRALMSGNDYFGFHSFEIIC